MRTAPTAAPNPAPAGTGSRNGARGTAGARPFTGLGTRASGGAGGSRTVGARGGRGTA